LQTAVVRHIAIQTDVRDILIKLRLCKLQRCSSVAQSSTNWRKWNIDKTEALQAAEVQQCGTQPTQTDIRGILIKLRLSKLLRCSIAAHDQYIQT